MGAAASCQFTAETRLLALASSGQGCRRAQANKSHRKARVH